MIKHPLLLLCFFSYSIMYCQTPQSTFLDSIPKNIEQLPEVIVNGNVSIFKSHSGLREVKVGDDLRYSAVASKDLLNNLAGIQTTPKGGITLRGQDNVRIFIDGAPTTLSSVELLNILPSTSIESIEVLTSPSAAEYPDGLSGIVNIITKPTNKKKAFYKADLNYGTTDKMNFAFSGGYKADKWEINAKYLYFQNKSLFKGETLADNETKSSVKGYFLGQSHEGQLNFSYNFSDKTKLSYGLSIRDIWRESPVDITSQSFNSSANSKADMYHIVNNLRFDMDFKEAHKIKIDFNYEISNTFSNGDFTQTFSAMPLQVKELSNYQNDYNFASFRVDYVFLASEYFRIKSGITSNYRNLNNPYSSLQITESFGAETKIPTQTHLKYEELVSGIYLDYTQFITSKFTASVALRADYANTMIKSVDTDKTFRDKGPDFFPSANLSYKFNENHKLMMFYSRRIARPDTRQLTPNEIRSNNIKVGNPFLKAQYANLVELTDVFEWKSGSLTSTAFFRNSSNIIQPYLTKTNPVTGEAISGRLFYDTFKNFGYANYAGVEFLVSQKVAGFMFINANINAHHVTFDNSENQLWNKSGTNVTAKLTMDFQISKNFSALLLARYKSPETTLQSVERQSSAFDIGASYSFWKKQAKVAVRVTDIFNTENSKKTSLVETSAGNFVRETNIEKFESRVIFVNLSFGF